MPTKYTLPKPPLIVTLLPDEAAQRFFNGLREAHFPKERNFISAHLTLFHALPNEEFIIEEIREISTSFKRFRLHVVEPVSIGKGVVFKLGSANLMHLHKTLQQKFQTFLTPQDRQMLYPHITVQNKVSPQQAKQLLDELKTDFYPFEMYGLGLQVWEYLNGPWRPVCSFEFNN